MRSIEILRGQNLGPHKNARRGSASVKLVIQDQGRRWTAAKDTGMAFDRRIFTLEAFGFTTVILSVAVMAGVLYSIW